MKNAVSSYRLIENSENIWSDKMINKKRKPNFQESRTLGKLHGLHELPGEHILPSQKFRLARAVTVLIFSVCIFSKKQKEQIFLLFPFPSKKVHPVKWSNYLAKSTLLMHWRKAMPGRRRPLAHAIHFEYRRSQTAIRSQPRRQVINFPPIVFSAFIFKILKISTEKF